MASIQYKGLLCHLGNRGQVLQTIQDGINDSREIASEVQKSRSSVDRDIRILVEEGYLQDEIGEYSLTKFGQYALEIYNDASHLCDIRSIVSYLPEDLPFSLVRNTIFRPSGGPYPREPLDHACSLLTDADKIKITTPTIFPTLIEILINRTYEESIRVGAVLTDDSLSQLLTKFPKKGRRCLQRENLLAWRMEEEIPYGVLVVNDDIAVIFVYDGSLRLLGTLVSEVEEVVNWIKMKHEELVEKSNPVFMRSASNRRSLVPSD